MNLCSKIFLKKKKSDYSIVLLCIEFSKLNRDFKSKWPAPLPVDCKGRSANSRDQNVQARVCDCEKRDLFRRCGSGAFAVYRCLWVVRWTLSMSNRWRKTARVASAWAKVTRIQSFGRVQTEKSCRNSSIYLRFERKIWIWKYFFLMIAIVNFNSLSTVEHQLQRFKSGIFGQTSFFFRFVMFSW